MKSNYHFTKPNLLKSCFIFILLELLLTAIAIKSCQAQQVPNTETFKLDTVVDVVNPTTDDLQDCFNDANASYFNATYNNDGYAPANSLLRFRDYKAPTATAPSVTTSAATSVSETTATLNGDVTSDGGATVTARGFRVSSSSNMSGYFTITTTGTTGTYNMESNTTCTNTLWYFQAYATNSVGTGLGSILNYTTTSPTLTAFTFYSQVDGVTINSSATAAGGANAAYWNQLGTNTNTTEYAASMTVGLRVFTTGTNPACEWISSTPGSTFWYTVKSGTSVWSIELDYDSKILTSTAYAPTTTTYTTSGTWTKPTNVKYIQVECWGGGGTGGPADGTGARAAGGTGGTYAKKVVAVTASTSYTIAAASTASTTARVDGNNTFFGASFGTALVAANGGVGGAVNTTTGGAAATTAVTTGSIGTTIYAGGNGGAGTSASYAGGGGGGAGSTGAGGNASTQTAGTGRSENGGTGGAGTNTTNTRNNGNTYGGAGSGGIATTATNREGGNGAAGYMRIIY